MALSIIHSFCFAVFPGKMNLSMNLLRSHLSISDHIFFLISLEDCCWLLFSVISENQLRPSMHISFLRVLTNRKILFWFLIFSHYFGFDRETSLNCQAFLITIVNWSVWFSLEIYHNLVQRNHISRQKHHNHNHSHNCATTSGFIFIFGWICWSRH